MKRFTAIIIAAALMLLTAGVCFAGGLSDEAPAPEAYSGFDDLGNTRAVLFDIDSGAILYSRNADVQAKPGSLTVIMTALLLIENTADTEWDTPIPALKDVNSKWSRRGASMGLAEGDTPTRRDLLCGLLLCGAADAAFVTGELVSGSESGFIGAMNARAEELGMTETNFDNGFGLGSNGHYSCAYDIALLTLEAMKHDIFASVVSSDAYTCSPGCRGLRLTNTNTALGSSGCIGVKSGEDSEREHSLVLGMQAGGVRLAAVILEAPSENASYSYADRLISAGLTRRISGTGLTPFMPTNALYTAKEQTSLSAEPGGTVEENVRAGECLNVIGYTETESGVYSCVTYRGRYLWAESDKLELNCPVDDVFIECGEALSREINKGDPIRIDSSISSRHEIGSVKLTLSLFDGTIAAMSSCSPHTHGVFEASGSPIASEMLTLSIPDGLYVCTIEAVVNAYLPGEEPQSFIKTGTSLLAVGTGGECVCYNANRGSSAPAGECFFGSFTIPTQAPERAGFEFSHWNTSPDNSGTSYRAGDAVESEGSLTLYAIWRAGRDEWSSEIRFGYDSGLLIEGFVHNGAGVSSVRLDVSGETARSFSSGCSANTVEPGSLLLKDPLTLEAGEYEIRLYARAAGSDEYALISSSDITVDRDADETAPLPSQTDAPEATEAPSPADEAFSLAGIPIWVWFMAGIVVVIVLISIIVTIIKRG